MLLEVDKILTKHNVWYSLSYGSALGAYREHGFIPWDLDIDILINIEEQENVRNLLRDELPSSFNVIGCDIETVSSYDMVVAKGIYEGDMHIDIYPLIGGPNSIEDGHKYQLKCRYVHKFAKLKYADWRRIQKKWKLPFVFIIKFIENIIPDNVIRKYIKYLGTKYDFKKSKYIFPFANDGKPGEYMEKNMLTETMRVPFDNLVVPIPANIDYYLSRIYGKDYMTPVKY